MSRLFVVPHNQILAMCRILARAQDKEFEAWLREIPGMDRLVEDCVGGKIPLWEDIMIRQGSVCCAWEKSAFEEGMKVGIRLMMEVYSL